MGGRHGLRGVPIDTDELAGSERFKKLPFAEFRNSDTSPRLRKFGHAVAIDESVMSDGGGVGNAVSARSPESLISLCNPW